MGIQNFLGLYNGSIGLKWKRTWKLLYYNRVYVGVRWVVVKILVFLGTLHIRCRMIIGIPKMERPDKCDHNGVLIEGAGIAAIMLFHL